VRRAVASVTAGSRRLRQLADAGQIKVVGSMYDKFSGAVTFLETAELESSSDETPRAEALQLRPAETA